MDRALQLDGVSFLTDPNWNTRSGPFGGFVGVPRYTPPGLRFEDLPRDGRCVADMWF